MRLLYGTANEAKLKYMKKIIAGLDIELMSLKDFPTFQTEVEETGRSPLENAKIKAIFYYQQTGVPVFSCDSGLYFEGVETSKQPGVHVRRVGGRSLNDEEMITYYTALAEEHGGELVARYQNAIALVLDEKTIYTYEGEDIASEKFIITSKPHEKRVKGFPLNSLSVEMESREYYFNLDRDENESYMNNGIRNFFMRTVLKS